MKSLTVKGVTKCAQV